MKTMKTFSLNALWLLPLDGDAGCGGTLAVGDVKVSSTGGDDKAFSTMSWIEERWDMR